MVHTTWSAYRSAEWKIVAIPGAEGYEYMVMPFGLSNNPVMFQCFVDILDEFVVIYLDILIFSENKTLNDQYV